MEYKRMYGHRVPYESKNQTPQGDHQGNETQEKETISRDEYMELLVPHPFFNGDKSGCRDPFGEPHPFLTRLNRDERSEIEELLEEAIKAGELGKKSLEHQNK